MTKSSILAYRLSEILVLLNQGKRLDTHQLAEEFNVSVRTIQRDIRDRFAYLDWEEFGPRYYKLNTQKLGFLDKEEIERFARFASVADLFPKVDQTFYQEKLTESIKVKGFQYEDIRHLENEFRLLKQAIEKYQLVSFLYRKSNQTDGKFYKIAPYSLINKNGIWYVIGTDQDKQKTFCFTQMTLLTALNETFEPNQQLQEEIKNNDSISVGNQLSEVLVKVSGFAAPYFLRRNLLPNQKLVHKAENGELILASENVNELDIIPLVQYWIPHLTVISHDGLQEKMVEKLKQYITNN
ncbi:YafY family protein [Actinobacillus porcinus]|uniref:helix-turn-helix transcriptional regulator n=1 Tax=Actinobacillus porcinus TaxID=51048 RepID=UPI0023F53760|nr:WYL domain-containing protein [Actinobacillus porcinus]MDD7545459.1 WYL domain-containing protein [Actinobacillus porcinus]MDY5848074.1 WYL domain-containing protein [Actinobacillus porcinus]